MTNSVDKQYLQRKFHRTQGSDERVRVAILDAFENWRQCRYIDARSRAAMLKTKESSDANSSDILSGS